MNYYKAYCKIPEIYKEASGGGVATGLAYHLLKSGYVQGVLVSRRYETFVAKGLNKLLESCGSIYEDFPYLKPDQNLKNLAQIGKPCDLDERFTFSISLFCSSMFSRQSNPITKKELRDLFWLQRYLKGLVNKPLRCRKCRDHIGYGADISVGDSQINPKLNHVIVWTEKGNNVWRESMDEHIIHAKIIDLEVIKNRQPYLWKGGKVKWIRKKLLK